MVRASVVRLMMMRVRMVGAIRHATQIVAVSLWAMIGCMRGRHVPLKWQLRCVLHLIMRAWLLVWMVLWGMVEVMVGLVVAVMGYGRL